MSTYYQDEFLVERRSVYDQAMNELRSLIAEGSTETRIDLQITEIFRPLISDAAMEFDGRDGASYEEAINTEAWLAVIWQLRKVLNTISPIISNEGIIRFGETQELDLTAVFKEITEEGLIAAITARLLVQSFPALQASRYFPTPAALQEYVAQYKAENKRLIELLNGVEGEI